MLARCGAPAETTSPAQRSEMSYFGWARRRPGQRWRPAETQRGLATLQIAVKMADASAQ